ncbi:MAG TPA: M28 family metallopeptidase, partial [Terriglobales bacterium]
APGGTLTLRTLLLTFALSASAFAQAAAKYPPEVKAGVDRITPATVRAPLTLIADDLFEGRAPGTRGGELAAKYIASRLEAMGLDPAGTNGSYFQQVPFREFTVIPDKCDAYGDQSGMVGPLGKFGEDYIILGSPFETSFDIEGKVVFVGYGAVVPSHKIDDYAGIDAKGKFVAIFRGGSPALPPEERAHYSTAMMLQAEAARHGAIGIVLLPTPESEKESPFKKLAENVDQPGLRWIGPDGKPVGHPEIRATVAISPALAEQVFLTSPSSTEEIFAALNAGKPQPFDTPYALKLHVETSHRDIMSPNVLAIRRGSDPKLKDEFVVYSAHYDHLGIGKPVNGDSVYNGAWDNATGVTSVLNIAEAFSALPKAPARSILFAFVTGEEKGLLGSDYFAEYPTVPKQSMIADLNIDMIPFFTAYKEVVVGPDRVGMNAAIQRVATAIGLPVVEPAKDAPQRGSFMTRSDGYSFIRRGIPTVSITMRGDQKNIDEFRKLYGTRYHQPNDDLTMPFNWEAGAMFARAQFLLGYEIANSRTRPSWRNDDWLAVAFGRESQSQAAGNK